MRSATEKYIDRSMTKVVGCKTVWTVRDEDEISAKVRTPDASAREYVSDMVYKIPGERITPE